MSTNGIPTKEQPTSSPFRASDHKHDGKKHLLLAASGSVATIKLPQILAALGRHHNLSVRLLLTKSAAKFLVGQSREQPPLMFLRKLKNVDGIYLDEEEWDPAWTRGKEILHIELRRWADILVIAPLSANTMAKMTAGIADNLLLSVVRAWDTAGEIDGEKKEIVVAPAMNTAMWRHPVTGKQTKILEDEWGVGVGGWIDVLRPIEKTLACGDSGDGAMREWSQIVTVIESRLGLEKETSRES